jgi:hypothetical protein
VGVHEAIGIHRYDPRLGVLLVVNLDSWVDHFEIGFYPITVSRHIQYSVLLFNTGIEQYVHPSQLQHR